jgi:hypothetical protein
MSCYVLTNIMKFKYQDVYVLIFFCINHYLSICILKRKWTKMTLVINWADELCN